MNTRWRFALVALALCFAIAAPAVAFEVPPAPPRFVYDGAGLLSAGDKQALEQRLMALDSQRGLQIGVAIFRSLDGLPVEEATLKVAEAWKPGFKDRNDGIVLGIFLADKKVRIEVGYGLEGAIPDALAGRVIRDRIAPAFREKAYGQGLVDAVDALAAAAKGETVAPPPRARGRGRHSGSPVAGIAVLAVLMAIFGIFGRLARAANRRRYLGDTNLPWWALMLIASRGSGGGGGRRDGGFFDGGGGGGWGGGGGSSFGGGSFGGGGASGGW